MRPDETTLHDLYQQMIGGWNKGSAQVFVEPLAEDVEFVPFDGVRIRGRADVLRLHEALFATHLRGTTLVGAVENVKFLDDSVAVMHAMGSTVMRGEKTPSKARDSIQTLVAHRRGNRWEIVTFHNTRVRPIGLSLLGTLHWLIGDWLWRFVPQSRLGQTACRTGITSPTAASL